MNSFLLVAPAAPRGTTAIRLGIAAALLAITAPAQIWQHVQPTVKPSARQDHGMVFDAQRDVTLLFGGYNWFGMSNETWTYNGIEWAMLQPAIAPPARDCAPLAYDQARQRVVLFGGFGITGGVSTTFPDTWEWDGATWIQVTPSQAPAPRGSFAMAYDEARARTVLFGGSASHYSPADFADTWTWDGADWTQVAPAHTPGVRSRMPMVYDSARSRCVLFGGNNSSWHLLDTTWEWDGTDWTMPASSHSPSPRSGVALAYDAAIQRVTLFGGEVLQSANDTWEYDGSDWVLKAPAAAPGPRFSAAMAFDHTRAKIVLFGGMSHSNHLDDTWLYTHEGGATFTPFGQGCPGSQGMPQLALAHGLPILGTTFQVACTNLQLDHFTTMWMGFSNTTWTLGSLPYNLGPFGMTGCTLFVSGDMVTALLNWNGTALWETTIPNAPQLVGLPFYLQAGVIDRVNNLGMVVTNAAEVRVGDH